MSTKDVQIYINRTVPIPYASPIHRPPQGKSSRSGEAAPMFYTSPCCTGSVCSLCCKYYAGLV